jgi:hypothetical protein
MLRWLLVVSVLLACGCVPLDVFQHDETAMVTPSQFNTAAPLPPPTYTVKSSPSSPEAAITVDRVGQQILTANKQLGIRPMFVTIGAGDPEIFHQRTGAVFITESLVRQCKNEGQLAALLSLEIGKMISERETLINPQWRDPPKPLPIAVTTGNAAQYTGMDQLYDAEVAKLDADRRRPTKKFVPPDPQVLAARYLQAAGFDSQELTATAPLVEAADKNYVMEKQINGARNPPTSAP